MTPTDRFREAYDAFPFGPDDSRIVGSPEWRGWWTRYREAVDKNARRCVGPYRPRLAGSDAAIDTVLRCLR